MSVIILMKLAGIAVFIIGMVMLGAIVLAWALSGLDEDERPQ